MTTVIAFVSQKGGVGKSTLSRALAREASASGMKVKIADLDTQQATCIDWNRIRLKKDIHPIIGTEMFGNADQALKAAIQYELFIIDAPARTSSGTLEIARIANLVVQPSGPSGDDLRPAVKEFHALVKAGIRQEETCFCYEPHGNACRRSGCTRIHQGCGI